MAAKGKTEAQVAVALGVSLTTLKNWKKKQPKFLVALQKGKDEADADVENSLYLRATGYQHHETDIRVIEGQIVMTQMTKHYPPDATSMIFWLKNRKPKEWRDKIETGVTDAEGKDVKPLDLYEAARKIAFLLTMGANQGPT